MLPLAWDTWGGGGTFKNAFKKKITGSDYLQGRFVRKTFVKQE